jgi:hypothetical protein
LPIKPLPLTPAAFFMAARAGAGTWGDATRRRMLSNVQEVPWPAQAFMAAKKGQKGR